MALTPILPTTATTDITFDSNSYKATISSYNITTDRQRFNATTFADENDGTKFLFGSSNYTATVSGLQYEGAAGAGLGIGIEDLDGKAFEIQANTNSSVSGTMQPSQGSTGRDAGNVGSASMTFDINGVTVGWDDSGT